MVQKTVFSVVIPAFNEEKNVVPLHRELKEVLDRMGKSYETIFVDDHSTDGTFSGLKGIAKDDKKVRIIRFRRNFGQTAAMDAGIRHSTGQYVITMDADLQNDPRDIPRMVAKLEKGYDCICGWRYKRKDGMLKIVVSRAANILRRSITGERVHDSGCSLRIQKRECFEDIDLYGEMHRYIPSLLLLRGFKIGEVKVSHRFRRHGQTKYSIARVLKGFLDLLVIKFWMQYSARPIHLFGGSGLLLSFLGVMLGGYLTFRKIFFSEALANRPLLLLSILLVLLGIQMIVFGFLADILIKVYYASKNNKPYFIEWKNF